jgi:hypothetical protein
MLTCCFGHLTHRTFTPRAEIRTLYGGGKASSMQLSAFPSRLPRHRPPLVRCGPVLAVAAQLLLLLLLLPLLLAAVLAGVVVVMVAEAAPLPAAEMMIQKALTKRMTETTTTVCEQRPTEPSSMAPPMPRSNRIARLVSRRDDWSLPVSDTPVVRCTAARFAVGTASLVTCPWQRPRSCATPFKTDSGTK